MVVVADEMNSTDDIFSVFNEQLESLEKQELEACVGIATPQIYGEMLAIYLLQNDMPNSKLLWKRIPVAVKQSNPELGKIWAVGTKLWNRDFSNVYALCEDEWSEPLKPIMELIAEKTRKRALDLVSKAYTSIHASDVAAFLNQSPEKVPETIAALGWTMDETNKIVAPVKPSCTPEELTPSEEQLAKLTDFVTFLET